MIVVTLKLNYFQGALCKTTRVNYYKMLYLSFANEHLISDNMILQWTV